MNTTIETTTGKTSLQNSSWQRICMILKKNIIHNRRNILMICAAYYGFWLGIGLMAGCFLTGGGAAEYSMFNMIAGLCSWVGASMIFSDMKTRKTRIDTLMLPASAAEKFWPRLIMALVIIPFVASLGYFLLELGRVLGTAIMTKHFVDMVMPWNFFEFMFDSSSVNIKLLIAYILSIMIGQAYFMFGSIYWPRYSFFKSLALLVIFMIITISVVFSLISNHILINSTILESDWVEISIEAIIMVIFCYFTYRKLKTITIRRCN